MKNEPELTTILVLMLGMFALLALMIGGTVWAEVNQPMPVCAEDAVIVGRGDFIDGRWEYYVCGPALDDFD